MKFIVIVFALLFFSNQYATAQAETDLVNKVKAKLDKVADYKATGKMHMDVSFIKAPASSITVYYKKPDQFKVVKQNGVSILPKGDVNANVNALLLTNNYTVVPAGTSTINGNTVKVVKLLPQDDNSDIVLTTLYIDDKAFVIKKSVVTTRENGSYEIDMDYGRYTAWGLPDKVIFMFNLKEYKLPKAVTFDYEKGGKKKEETIKNKKGKVEITYEDYRINQGIADAVFKSR